MRDLVVGSFAPLGCEVMSAPGVPASFGIVAAFSHEVGPLVRSSKGVARLGDGRFRLALRGRPAMLAIAGAGTSNARQAAEELIRVIQPAALISIGFAAGLRQELATGMLMLADEVIEQSTSERFACDPKILDGLAASRGSLLSVSRVIGTAEEKVRLGTQWNALAADMESGGVARAARAAGLPFAALKCVTDGCEESIAIDFQRCGSEHGGLAVRKIIREAFTSLQGVRDLIRLAAASRRAAQNLAIALGSSSREKTVQVEI